MLAILVKASLDHKPPTLDAEARTANTRAIITASRLHPEPLQIEPVGFLWKAFDSGQETEVFRPEIIEETGFTGSARAVLTIITGGKPQTSVNLRHQIVHKPMVATYCNHVTASTATQLPYFHHHHHFHLPPKPVDYVSGCFLLYSCRSCTSQRHTDSISVCLEMVASNMNYVWLR